MFCCCAVDDSETQHAVNIDDFQENSTKYQPGDLGAGIEVYKVPQAFYDDETPVDSNPAPTHGLQADGTFKVNIVKNKGSKLGMRLDHSDRTLLKVTRIGDGIIREWNAKNPAASVSVNDCIISINDKKGSAAELLEEIASRNSLDILFKKSKGT
mmetsp:Transcript_72006/g.112775  ORF Transcript_72006/g.112775 Transcript_72006/m.112775 type:complete len:155 (+) Transcript_72006:90-554(+)|eukprot:CAMPEP_0169129798 /NCGR_PEP_ID=MMETSP1015-20121227/37343_1 /TAXON_ID=342587 /ORGANISM="Karlodinium micrum, Strain CCMP2283" /LENGTH=154 /DNA_ID=CAMNT_0009193891 /DNA_START=97 /DNA_END=561 /DNA_ORIENTATION=-